MLLFSTPLIRMLTTKESKVVSLEKHCCWGETSNNLQTEDTSWRQSTKEKKKEGKLRKKNDKNQNAHQHPSSQRNVPSNEETVSLYG